MSCKVKKFKFHHVTGLTALNTGPCPGLQPAHRSTILAQGYLSVSKAVSFSMEPLLLPLIVPDGLPLHQAHMGGLLLKTATI